MSDHKDTETELRAKIKALEAELDRTRGEVPAAAQGDAATLAQGEANQAASHAGVAAAVVHDSLINTGTLIIKPDPNDPVALEQAYLSGLVRDCSYLELSGVDPAAAGEEKARLRLDAVYTALMTTTLEQGAEPTDRQPQPLSALALVDREPRLVLLGDPGSGKSTFVNFLTLCLAQEQQQADSGLPRLTAPLPDEQGEDQEQRQPWGLGALLPVPVVLRDYAARDLKEQRGLWTHIRNRLQDSGLAGFIPRLRERLETPCVLLLLDGLDEVPGDQRDNRRSRVNQAVEAFAAEFPNCRILVTCRGYAYQQGDLALSGFTAGELAALGDGQIHRFIQRWYAHSAELGRVGADEAGGLAALLDAALFRQPQLLDLARRPLLLTLMASLHAWRKGRLPEDREQLYGETVDLLLDRWEGQRVVRDPDGSYRVIQPSLEQYLKAESKTILSALQGLAFDAHRQQGLEKHTADIAEQDLLLALMNCGADTGKVHPDDLIEYLRDRAGLLHFSGEQRIDGRPRGVYAFPHRSFQEYLAACHLAGNDEYPEPLAGLLLQDPERWREVGLLSAAHASRNGSLAGQVWSLVAELCPPGRRRAGWQWGAHLAAQVLVELTSAEKRAEVSANKRTTLKRVIGHVTDLIRGDVLPARERALAGDHLAALGDPRFDPDCWHLPRGESLGFLAIRGGEFTLGSDDPQDKYLADPSPAHRYRLPDYWMARWPVTVDQFRTFVDGADHEPRDKDCVKGPGNRPVALVTWHDALAYCRWLDGRLAGLARERVRQGSDDPMWRGLANGGLHVALPSEPEWEWAARGPDGWPWPFDGDLDAEKANYWETRIEHPSSVGCFPLGVSPYGVEEMAGNVWEWTRSLTGDYPYPQSGEALQAREFPGSDRPRVLRGGSFFNLPRYLRAAVRVRNGPHLRLVVRGFRVVLSPLPLASGLSDR